MIEALNAALVCGLLFIPCIHRQLTTTKVTEQQKLCSAFKDKPDWCISKVKPIYPTINRDTTQ